MTNERTDLAAKPESGLAVPQPEGLDRIGDYQLLQRLKVVQGMTDADLRREFPTGTVLLMPDRVLVAKPREAFEANLLCHWKSWELWPDIRDAEAGGRPIETTLDGASEIAQRASDFERRKEPYPDNTDKRQWFRRYVESLNFALLIETGGASGDLAVLSYNKGSHKIGARLERELKRRARNGGRAIYVNRLALSTHEENGPEIGTYEVIGWNSAVPPFVEPGTKFDMLRKTWQGLEDAYAKRLLAFAEEPKGAEEDTEGDMGDDSRD